MDPLSLTASAIAVATLAAQVGSTLTRIQNFPGRLQATKNELTNLGGVLPYIETVLAERKNAQVTDHSLDILHSLIAQIESKLRELERVLIRLQGLPSAPRKPIVVAANWMKERGNIQMIQEDLRAMKINLSMYQGTANS